MKIKYILYDKTYENKFNKYIKRLSIKKKRKLQKKIKIFKNNIFDKRLRAHKLKGNLKEYYVFSINYKDRLVFKLIDEETVYFIDIGDHDTVY